MQQSSNNTSNDKIPYQLPKLTENQISLFKELVNLKEHNLILENYINILNSTIKKDFNIQYLKDALMQIDKQFRDQFLGNTIIQMGNCALNYEMQLGEDLHLLVEVHSLIFQNSNNIIIVTQRQAFVLLSLAFFNLLRYPSYTRYKFPYPCSFFALMNKEGFYYEQYKVEKLKSIINYFNQQSLNEAQAGNQYITIERLRFKKEYHVDLYFNTDELILNEDVWTKSECPLISEIQFIQKGRMEENSNQIVVDFANKFIGGGVLSHGMVQEEILFTINPEAMISIFLTSVLKDDEALMIDGIRQFSDYTGYKEKFKTIPLQAQQKYQTFLAIDALNFSKKNIALQWSNELILRELNKAFIGFSMSNNCSGRMMNKNICTGRWGCGAFKGDSRLKFLLQWIAFSQSSSSMEAQPFIHLRIRFLNPCRKLFKIQLQNIGLQDNQPKASLNMDPSIRHRICIYLTTYGPPQSYEKGLIIMTTFRKLIQHHIFYMDASNLYSYIF